jgi:maleate isomerase
MTKNRTLLGMLTPSSNTWLEPLTSAMLASLPDVTAHFARFPVSEISLSDHSLGQFDESAITHAAQMLADARVDVIAWNGTSAGWLGFETDERLCRRITEITGIPATTSVLALNEILRKTNVRELGLVTPYVDSVQKKIIDNYHRTGVTFVNERHLNLQVNFFFAEVPVDTIRTMVREVATSRPGAISIFCTNLNAVRIVSELEQEIGIPVYDTIATAVWKSLQLAGYDTSRLASWGRLFSEVF